MNLTLSNSTSLVITLLAGIAMLACTTDEVMGGSGGGGGADISNRGFDAGNMANMLYTCVDANEDFYVLQLAPRGRSDYHVLRQPFLYKPSL